VGNWIGDGFEEGDLVLSSPTFGLRFFRLFTFLRLDVLFARFFFLLFFFPTLFFFSFFTFFFLPFSFGFFFCFFFLPFSFGFFFCFFFFFLALGGIEPRGSPLCLSSSFLYFFSSITFAFTTFS